MKQVIKNNTSSYINVNEIQPNKYFVARCCYPSMHIGDNGKTKCETYTLEFETIGFIFRPSDTSDSSGHSGRHRSPAEAIENALGVGNTEVFQFDSIRELVAFVADNAKV